MSQNYIYICDRCKCELRSNDAEHHPNDWYCLTDCILLCSKCHRLFQKWLKMIKEEE